MGKEKNENPEKEREVLYWLSKLVILGLVLIYLMSVYKMQTQTSNPFLYYQF